MQCRKLTPPVQMTGARFNCRISVRSVCYQKLRLGDNREPQHPSGHGTTPLRHRRGQEKRVKMLLRQRRLWKSGRGTALTLDGLTRPSKSKWTLCIVAFFSMVLKNRGLHCTTECDVMCSDEIEDKLRINLNETKKCDTLRLNKTVAEKDSERTCPLF